MCCRLIVVSGTSIATGQYKYKDSEVNLQAHRIGRRVMSIPAITSRLEDKAAGVHTLFIISHLC
jgi:hypothetical protein